MMAAPDLRSTMARFLASLDYDYFVTLTTNLDDVTDDLARIDRRINTMRKSLRDWEARVDRVLLGPKWLKKKQEHGIFAAYTAENISTNIHAHLLLKVRCPHDPTELARLVELSWTAIWPYGTAATDPIDRIEGLTVYVTKQINTPKNWEAFDFIGPIPVPGE